jgi:hypothetical protein
VKSRPVSRHSLHPIRPRSTRKTAGCDGRSSDAASDRLPPPLRWEGSPAKRLFSTRVITYLYLLLGDSRPVAWSCDNDIYFFLLVSFFSLWFVVQRFYVCATANTQGTGCKYTCWTSCRWGGTVFITAFTRNESMGHVVKIELSTDTNIYNVKTSRRSKVGSGNVTCVKD